jgi:hypothetical protein
MAAQDPRSDGCRTRRPESGRRGGDVAGVQASAGGALVGDQLTHPGAAVGLGPAAVAGGGAVVGCGQLQPGERRRGGVAVAAAILAVGHRDRRDGADLLAPLQPALDQLGDRAGAAAALLAPVELLQDLGLDLPGLVPGRLGLAANLPAEPSLAAGEGNDCGNDMPALSPTRWAASAQPMLWGPTLLGTTEPSANSFTGQQRGIEGC